MVSSGNEEDYRISKRVVRRGAVALVVVLVAAAAYGLGNLTSRGAGKSKVAARDQSRQSVTTSSSTSTVVPHTPNTKGTTSKVTVRPGTTTRPRTTTTARPATTTTASPSSTRTTPPTTSTPLPGVLRCAAEGPLGGPVIIRPAALNVVCGGISTPYIASITWQSWSPTSAVGVGNVSYDTCVPDCAAAGTEVTYQATITLSSPVEYEGYLTFNALSVTPSVPGFSSFRPNTSSNGYGWGWESGL